MQVRFDAWTAADPALADPTLRADVKAVIDMVRSDWTAVPQLDVMRPALIALLDRHRISTLFPLEAVPEEHRPEFRERFANIQATQMRIQATAIDVLERFNAAGIESRVMKGLASAELDYPRPEFRYTGDVDLAVRPADLARAVDILEAANYGGRPRRAKNMYVIKGATLDGPRRVEVDIHDRLFIRSRYSDELFDDPGIELQSLPGRAFAAELRLVNAAGSFALTPNGHKRLSGLIDVMRLLDQGGIDQGGIDQGGIDHRGVDAGGVDLRRVLDLASSLKVATSVGAVLTMQAEMSGRPVDARWPQPDWLDRQIRFGTERKLVLEKLGRFRNMPLRSMPGYVPEWLLPDAHEREMFKGKVRDRWSTLRNGRSNKLRSGRR